MANNFRTFLVALVLICLKNQKRGVTGTPISFDANNNLLIVGGSEATPHEFPWLASLHWQEGQFCSGVIVSPTQVLTTASCATLITAYYLEIYAGLHHLTQNTSVGVQKRNPTQILLHPEHSSGPGGVLNDLAILRLALSTQFVFGDYVSAIRLPVRGQGQRQGQVGTVAGWGSVAEEAITLQDVLQKADVTIREKEECADVYGDKFDLDKMICAGGGTGDFCNGDVGGPLMMWDEEGMPYLAGIASWGQGCGDSNYPSVYTDVSAYLDWIEANP